MFIMWNPNVEQTIMVHTIWKVLKKSSSNAPQHNQRAFAKSAESIESIEIRYYLQTPTYLLVWVRYPRPSPTLHLTEPLFGTSCSEPYASTLEVVGPNMGETEEIEKKSLFCTVKHDHKTTFMLVFLPSGRWFWFLFRIGGGTPHSPNRNRYAEWNQSCVTTIGGLNGGSTDSAVGKRAMDG